MQTKYFFSVELMSESRGNMNLIGFLGHLCSSPSEMVLKTILSSRHIQIFVSLPPEETTTLGHPRSSGCYPTPHISRLT